METAKVIINTLENNRHQAIIVGGYIRDMLLGIESSDVDIATSATLEEVQDIFPTCKAGVGANFNVNIVEGYEVATFRKDIYNSLNDVSVETVKSFKLDSERRDLTINSMGFDPIHSRIIDYHGGQKDIENKLIRFVDVAELRILEDPVRMLRACRFAAKLNFRLVPSAFFAIKDNAHLIDEVPVERIKNEIMKAMKIEKPSIFWELLQRTGLLKRIIPELDDCWYHDGGNYHSEFIHEHLMECGDNLPKDQPLLRIVGYFHDIGKVEAYDEHSFSFLRHEMMGADITRDILLRLKFSTDEINFIIPLILYHMRMLDSSMSDKAMRKNLMKFEKEKINWRDFLRLRISDTKANARSQNYKIHEIKTFVQMFNKALNPENVKPAFGKSSLEVNGNDIMKHLEISPGAIIGCYLDILLDDVLEDPEVNTKETLLELLEEI